jgi:diacylglycerol kinase (ATP)
MEDGTGFSLRARLRSFEDAGRGLRTLLVTQHNARIHAVASVLVLGLAAGLGVTRVEGCLLALAIAAVWTAEALNTALELLCDVASPEFHPTVGRAKDVAAGGVLAMAAGAAVVGLLVLVPRLLPG